MLLRPDAHRQLAAQDKQELDAWMVMRPGSARRQRLEFCVIRVQFFGHRGEIERLKVISDVSPVGPLRKALALAPPHDRKHPPLLLVGEKCSSPTLKTRAMRSSVGSVG